MVDQQIPCDTGHPRGKSSVCRAVTAESPVYPQENFLGNILGFGAVADEAVAHIENAARVAAHKFLPGRAIALEATLDQLGILLQAFLAPFSSNLLRHNSLLELLGLSSNGT